MFLLFFLTGHADAQTLILDAGHGGVDKGVVRDIFIESHITLSVTQKVKQLLHEQLPEIKVILTRDSDTTRSLQQRINIASENKADLFMSLHANSSSSSQVSGMEFYFKTPLNYARNNLNSTLVSDYKSAATLSPNVKKILSEVIDFGLTNKSLFLSELLQFQSPTEKNIIRRAPYYVIENSPSPAVLVELGFITNKSEAKKLYDDKYQDEVAQSIVNSIKDYFASAHTRL